MKPVLCVVGARPNFIKMAPILRAMQAQSLPAVLVHTGQHYDSDMSTRLFAALGLPAPDVNLGVGQHAQGHVQQTAEVMRRFAPLLDRLRPAAVLVVGDVNSTLACALVARQCGVLLLHVEGGLRSFDRSMPEELNRVLTDQMADRIYTTEAGAAANLAREGIAAERVVFVGNVMIDSVVHGRQRAQSPHTTLRRCGADAALLDDPRGYGVVTLHRPSNVDDPHILRELLGALRAVALRLPLVFAMHPRTRGNIARFGLSGLLEGVPMARLGPQDYLEMLGLMLPARLVLTDSGGVQEESTALGLPCLTLRDNTERPVTVEQGSNTLVGRNRQTILGAVQAVLDGRAKRGRVPEGWDGHAAERLVDDLQRWLATF